MKRKKEKKENKQNFNFFYGIAYNKTYLEKYHSNFIAYLLDPKESHDCDSLFLSEFLEIVKSKISIIDTDASISNEVIEKGVVFRERDAKGRRIDITIESNNTEDWIIFIENKIRSTEGDEQVADYLKFAGGYKKHIGIYLTLNGDKPESYQDNSKIICLSYKEDIIAWLEKCREHENLQKHSIITNALNQYLSILKKELNIMEEKQKEEIIKYLNENVEKAKLIIEYQDYLREVVDDFVTKKRQEFFNKLVEKIQLELNGVHEEFKFTRNRDEENDKKVFWIYKKDSSDFKLLIELTYPNYVDGGRGIWWGVYGPHPQTNGLPCGLEHDFWESIKINGTEDYSSSNDGSIKIIELIGGTPDLLEEELNNITSVIICKIKKNILQK